MAEIHKLYGGAVEIIFNEKNHRYYIGKRSIPNATTVTGMAAKDALIYWAASVACDFIRDNLQPGVGLDEVEITNLIEEARTKHTERKKEAATIGSHVHAWIENYIKFRIANPGQPIDMKWPVNDIVRASVMSFLEWEKEEEIIYHSSEKVCYSIHHDYTGTLDIKCTRRGQKAIGDIKTSSGIYANMIYQVCGYINAEMEESGDTFPGSFIIQIPKDGGPVNVFEITDGLFLEGFNGFLGCLKLYHADRQFKKLLKEMFTEGA